MTGEFRPGFWGWALIVLGVLIAVYFVNNLLHYWKNERYVPKEPVVNQTAGDMKKLRFGFFQSGFNGCGWIAVYNALRLMGREPDAGKLIAELEWTGAMLFGVLGTWPYSVAHYFRLRGYRVRVTYRAGKYDETAREHEVNIIWFFHRKGAHFVTLRWREDRFEGYNTYSNSVSPDSWGCSIERFLKDRNYRPVMLISVSPKK